MSELFRTLPLPAADEKQLKPTFGQTMGAAFDLENDVTNLYEYMTKPAYPADPNFNFRKEFEATGLPPSFMMDLAKAQSKPEFDATLAKVQKEYQDRAVLAASGWSGTVAAMAAGMLSPTVFIPFAGQARGAKGMAQILALAGAGATAQNAALFLNQETRTEAELYAGIALDTALLGLMGGAYMALTRPARRELQLSLKLNEKKLDVPQGAPDLPVLHETSVRVEGLRAAEVKAEVKAEGIRDPEEVKALLDEAEDTGAYVPLKDRALAIGQPKRVRAKDIETQMAYGGSYLEAEVADGVTARFVKVPAGSGGKWFVGGEYSVTLHRPDGSEIRISNVDTFAKAGNTMIDKEAELKAALAEGKLDDQLYTMLEAAEDTDMARYTKQSTIPDSAATGRAVDADAAGAQVSRSRNTLGAKAAPNKVRQAAMNTLGKMSPSYRMLTQRFFPSLRDAIAKLDTSGIQQAGLEKVEPSALGGTVIERIRGYDAYVVAFTKKLDELYFSYVYDGAKGNDMDMPAFTQLRSQFGWQPAGKLDWQTYKAQIFEQAQTGEISPDLAPAVAEFKKFFDFYNDTHKRYLREMESMGIEVEPLYQELLEDKFGEGIKAYAHHIFDQQKLMENFSDFLDDFGKANEKALQESFAKAREAYIKKRGKLEFEQQVSQLTPAQMADQLTQTEASIEFLDELSELQSFNARRLGLNKQAKDEGWTKEQLKEAQKQLADGLDEDTKTLLLERKRLLGVGRAYKKFGGDAGDRTTKLRAELDKQNELIAEMFRTELPKITSVDLNIEKIQVKGDKALSGLVTQMTKVVKELQKREANLAKLAGSKRKNPVSFGKAQEMIERTKLRHERMLERLSMVGGQQVALDQRLRELQLLREDVIADATTLVRSRAVRAEAAEEKLDTVAKKVLTPEDQLRMRDQIARELEDLEADFTNTWSASGEASGDPVNTTSPDFREKSIEMATQLHQRLTNTEVELSPAYLALARQGERGAELMRTMNIPFSMKKKWLINDVELVARAYDRVMAPDLEIWRAFEGSVNGKNLLGQMAQEATDHMVRIGTAKFVKLPKGWVDKSRSFSEKVKARLADAGALDEIYLDEKSYSDVAKEGFVEITPELRTQLGNYVSDAVKFYTNDFDVAIQRLRMTRGVPRDGQDPWWRAGRFIKNVNVLTMMGGVVTSSISDVARPVWQHGVSRVYRHGWAPFINKLDPRAKEFRLKSKEINRQIGLNLEPVLHSRAQAVFDLAEDSIGRTRLERGAGVLAGKMGLVALYDFWTAGMKTIAGNVTHATLAAYIPAVAKAWRENAEFTGDLLEMRTYLRNLGLGDININRIAMQMEAPGGMEKFSNGGVLPNVDKWDDVTAYQAYQAAVLGEVNKLIVTPGLERPNWTDANMGFSMLAQFKSFTFASNSRMTMSALQGNDPYLMQGVTFSLALGALSYYTYAMTAGGKTLETANQMNAEKWIWEAVKRSGILGATGIAADVGAEMPVITGDQTATIFRRPGGMLGTLLGPTYSQAERMATVLTQLDAEDQSRNMRMIRQMIVPYQNHFIFRQLFDRVGDAMYGDN